MVDRRRLRFYSSLFGVAETKRKMAENGDDTASVSSSHSSIDCAGHSGAEYGLTACAEAAQASSRPVCVEHRCLIERVLLGAELIHVVLERLKYQSEPHEVCDIVFSDMTSALFAGPCLAFARAPSDTSSDTSGSTSAAKKDGSSSSGGGAQQAAHSTGRLCKSVAKEVLSASPLLVIKSPALLNSITAVAVRRLLCKLERPGAAYGADIVAIALALIDTLRQEHAAVRAALPARAPTSEKASSTEASPALCQEKLDQTDRATKQAVALLKRTQAESGPVHLQLLKQSVTASYAKQLGSSPSGHSTPTKAT